MPGARRSLNRRLRTAAHVMGSLLGAYDPLHPAPSPEVPPPLGVLLTASCWPLGLPRRTDSRRWMTVRHRRSPRLMSATCADEGAFGPSHTPVHEAVWRRNGSPFPRYPRHIIYTRTA